ncbi:MAG: hypothetical protein KGJ36_00340 [Acidobacteriota bacterium]|nr:hypothetical protein [Acidobacteriota bacterium]
MSALRSPGWTVRPSFVPHGATNDVTLLADDAALTQLRGVPDAAWQTPWGELGSLHLVRHSRGMALFATAAGVRYCWRTSDLGDYEAWREVVLAHGGTVARRPRRAGVVVVVGAVLLASFAGGIAALVSGPSAGSHELAAARAVNLRLDDLPGGWSVTSASFLGALAPPPGQVVTSSTTPTTRPSPTSKWGKITALFQSCLGVSDARDRVFGAAGQQPDYQVSSPVFRAASYGGIDVASTTQYYATTAMVNRDRAEMSDPRFGSCFAAANAAMILTYVNGTVPGAAPGATWRPATYVRGWARGGETLVRLPGVAAPVHLVVAVVATGHFEVTLTALVARWPQSRGFLAGVVNTLIGRTASPSATAA